MPMLPSSVPFPYPTARTQHDRTCHTITHTPSLPQYSFNGFQCKNVPRVIQPHTEKPEDQHIQFDQKKRCLSISCEFGNQIPTSAEKPQNQQCVDQILDNPCGSDYSAKFRQQQKHRYANQQQITDDLDEYLHPFPPVSFCPDALATIPGANAIQQHHTGQASQRIRRHSQRMNQISVQQFLLLRGSFQS